MTNANAGLSSATGTANNATKSFNILIGLISQTGAANNTFVIAENPNAYPATATGTGAAFNLGVGPLFVHNNIASGTSIARNITPKGGPSPLTLFASGFIHDAKISLEWWNSSYWFRRVLVISNPIEDASVAHPVQYDLDIDRQVFYGKIRPDYQDIEVIFSSNEIIPAFTVLGREVTSKRIRFNLIRDLAKGTVRSGYYFVYFGNWHLEHQPSRPMYVENLWPISRPYSDGRFAYTRPGEHWNNGKASLKTAVATLHFISDRIRIKSNVGPNQGIAEISIDEGLWKPIDLYSGTKFETVVFTADNLTQGPHKIQMRPAARKSPMSSGVEVNFTSMEYWPHLIVTDNGEEIQNVTWASAMSGAF